MTLSMKIFAKCACLFITAIVTTYIVIVVNNWSKICYSKTKPCQKCPQTTIYNCTNACKNIEDTTYNTAKAFNDDEGNTVELKNLLKADLEPFKTWTHSNNVRRFCDDKVIVYADRFAELHNVVMYPGRRDDGDSQTKGGEHFPFVLEKKFKAIDFKFKYDFWEANCPANASKPNMQDKIMWLKNLKLNSEDQTLNMSTFKLINDSQYTIAVRRQDFWNLHNFVRNTYNVFLMMIFYKIQASDITILFMDGHSFTNLDTSWQTLFKSVLRVGHMQAPILYSNFIWGLQENHGPITEIKDQAVPYLEEYRSFMLTKHNVSSKSNLMCDRIKITLIVRRDTLLSPKNNVHNVGRKIANEAETLLALRQAFGNAEVQAVLMDALPMISQLEIVSQTDLLIGMHGAGMSHVVFLPKHAGVLEMFSKGFKIGRPWYVCYYNITQWRGLKYDSWENFDSSYDMANDYTIIPTEIITERAQKLHKKICNLS